MNVNSPPSSDPTEPLSYEEASHRWLAEVYQGDKVRQLSVRSIVTGMLIGGVMSISNLYVGLKTGWGLGVTITSCIIAYAVFNVLEKIVPRYRKDPFTILENYTMSSAASAAGYMSSAGLVSAIPALYLATGRQLGGWEIMAWLAAVSTLGVFMAIPLKRQLINIDQLPFPTGIATAETLRSMHTAGMEALQKAKALFWSAVIGGLVAVWRDGLPQLGAKLSKQEGTAKLGDTITSISLPSEFPLLPGSVGKRLNEELTLGFEGSLIMIGAGAIMGIRIGCSLLLGAVIYYGVMAPILIAGGHAQPGYRGIVAWTLWPATAMMVTSGLTAFALRWRTVLRAFSGLTALLGENEGKSDPLAHVEVPGWWFVAGTAVSGAACVWLGHKMFEITWWMGLLAVALTFLLSIVAARATGETDITPIGAMGKITQLMYGAIAPSNIPTNLMTASITAGAASHSADLLSDLKSGYLLGGNPRKQTISQLFGVAAGTLFCVPVYIIVVDPEKLGSVDMPAPSAKVWESVARLLAKGLDALPAGAVWAMVIGGVLGIALALAEEFVPRKYRWCVPSPTGLGIAGVIPAFNAISMFMGAWGAWWLSRARPDVDKKYTVACSSGLIAGESLMGVAIIFIAEGPRLIGELSKALSGGS